MVRAMQTQALFELQRGAIQRRGPKLQPLSNLWLQRTRVAPRPHGMCEKSLAHSMSVWFVQRAFELGRYAGIAITESAS